MVAETMGTEVRVIVLELLPALADCEHRPVRFFLT